MGGIEKPAQGHPARKGAYRNSGWIPAPQEPVRPHPDHLPAAPRSPFQPPGRQAALKLHASWLVPEPSATAPQSSKIVCVHRCLWRCMHVLCFAFPFSSWQVPHFQSAHWVNFCRFKTIAGKCFALRSRRGSGHRARCIVWLSWHLGKLP